ncbi:type II toxin-antitoxin system VapC family toxin [Salinisphaera japonica]|uniref:Twitching motility protein PilT n=1 Tax=Salinisphaera japonica YTM-1 TaxID=1209778 RepID=A0A423PYS3_9GAMM|nr:type II toxin-antitoxin system VapC family toxin [Salinisphaera japonica]ROO30749.1 twitching motility protein PilT [Salinisphaera japonica YTM-1]
MIVLLDTHLLLWAAAGSNKLPPRAADLIQNETNQLLFSAASLWEVAIKAGLNRPDFKISAGRFRRALFENGYDELPISGRHAAAIANLPDIHKDPFDRILIAQAQVEDLTLCTSDRIVARYPGHIELF